MALSVATPTVPFTASSCLRRYKRILLADDDPVVLHLLTEVLSDSGYCVVPCCSGVTAVEQFRKSSRFDLLMTDFEMPQMNGVTLANLLTSVSRKLKVLIVSGAPAEEIALWELWRKNWCFLAKPMKTELLLKTVDQLCGLVPIHVADVLAMG